METSAVSPGPTPRSGRSPAEVEALRARVDSLPWFHRLDLGDGIVTPGVEHNGVDKLDHVIIPPDLRGKSVLDVGAWDGLFSFEAERRGAARVLATDSYSWGGGGWGSKASFELAREELGSRVEDLTVDVMELSPERVGGTFDVVLFLGVLYHLRDPLLALERVASVTGELLVLQTQLGMLDVERPAMAFHPGDELGGDPTNWWSPNPACVEALLRTVGFSAIEMIFFEHGLGEPGTPEGSATFYARRSGPAARATGSRPVRETASEELFASPRSPALEECRFYHAMGIPGVGELQDVEWDLRAGIDDYLGRYDFAGKRVLEVGPATGYITSELERRGAEVVAVELESGASYDFVPVDDEEMLDLAARDDLLESRKNGFWYVHNALGLSARMHYGDVRRLPRELGRFDVCLIAAVLLHSSDPINLITSCAARTDEAMIITDVRGLTADAPDRRGDPVAVLLPTIDNRVHSRWWTFSPEFFTQLLAVLGFPNSRVLFHEQRYVAIGLDQAWFTVVAQR